MTEWHVPDDLVVTFAMAPRSLDDAAAASVEQHVAVCASCQREVARASSTVDLDVLWAEVEDRIDRHGHGWAGWLGRLSGHSTVVRLLTASPGLRLSTVVAAAMVSIAGSLAARALDLSGVFLAIAPLVPLGLVAATFSPGVDPAGEASQATPVHGPRLLVLRLAAISLVSAAVLAVGTAVAPLHGPRAAAWVLPALALSAVTIAGSARWSTSGVAIVSAGSWAGLVLGASRLEPANAVTSSVLFDASGQVVFAVVAGAAIAVVTHERDLVGREVFR